MVRSFSNIKNDTIYNVNIRLGYAIEYSFILIYCSPFHPAGIALARYVPLRIYICRLTGQIPALKGLARNLHTFACRLGSYFTLKI